MIDGFAFLEIVRKLANLIRIGKVTEIDSASVKVKIGRVVTGWLPTTAGDTTGWIPISKDEQVVVFAPYGELTQTLNLCRNCGRNRQVGTVFQTQKNHNQSD